MYTLGISCFYHDSSACLLKDGKVQCAIQEERLTRKKNDDSFPIHSIRKCLEFEGITIDQIESVVYYEKPFIKFERIVETYLIFSRINLLFFFKSASIWMKEKLFLKRLILKQLKREGLEISKNKLLFCEHHISHAASAFYYSPFQKALVLNIDGVGEWSTTTLMIGEGQQLSKVQEISFPHSLGLLYSCITSFLGFKVNSDEYKVMGLASYGKPLYKKLIVKNLIDIKNDGSYRLNLRYFNFGDTKWMFTKQLGKLFQIQPRKSDESLQQFHADIAKSIQEVLEEILILMVNKAVEKYAINDLCMSGGVALNCVANGRILKESKIKRIWIQPASGDAGGSLGAGAYVSAHLHGLSVRSDKPFNPYLGPSYKSFSPNKHELSEFEVRKIENRQTLNELVADLVSEGKVVGWFQDRMEFGPRALGNRSIIADPRDENMISVLNLKVKFRESFRPFAPAIMEEYAGEYFEKITHSPYMLLVDQLRADKLRETAKKYEGFESIKECRSVVPAITHVDNSARIQTVTRESNEKFYELIEAFYKKTGVPMLINTSFNLKDEPIVCSPVDALRCFRKTNIDALVINDYLILKK
ncbi:MAG: carbamoyltransferase [Cyclobacteriaceae bacterium]